MAIRCDTCPRCYDAYPDKTDPQGNHFQICGMSGNMVYTTPRTEKRYSGKGYIHYGVSTCGLYETVEDALGKMTNAEIRRLAENRKAEGHEPLHLGKRPQGDERQGGEVPALLRWPVSLPEVRINMRIWR